MKTILIQGINANVGASTIASAITYQLSELGKTAVLIDANTNQQANSVSLLLGVSPEKQNTGWINDLTKNSSNLSTLSGCFYKYENNSFCIPLGSIDALDREYLPELADNLLALLFKQKNIDYLIIDAGERNNHLAAHLSSSSDIIFTVVEADGNCVQRLNSIQPAYNEFFIINKLNSYSQASLDIQSLLLNSKLKQSFIKTAIPFDESVVSSYMNLMPFNRFLKISSASLQLEKIIMELFIMCRDIDMIKDQN